MDMIEVKKIRSQSKSDVNISSFRSRHPIQSGVGIELGVVVDELSRLKLTGSHVDECKYDRGEDDAWEIESICFEDGKYVATDMRDK